MKLRRCPFCGRKDPVLSKHDPDDLPAADGGRTVMFYGSIHCGCGAQMTGEPRSTLATADTAVAQQWNMRVLE